MFLDLQCCSTNLISGLNGNFHASGAVAAEDGSKRGPRPRSAGCGRTGHRESAGPSLAGFPRAPAEREAATPPTGPRPAQLPVRNLRRVQNAAPRTTPSPAEAPAAPADGTRLRRSSLAREPTPDFFPRNGRAGILEVGREPPIKLHSLLIGQRERCLGFGGIC